MNHVTLNISGCVLRIDLSRLEQRVGRSLIEAFPPFVTQNGGCPDETMDVMPVKTRVGKAPGPELAALIRESLEIPLRKFPFTSDFRKDAERIYAQMIPFLKEDEVIAFLKGMRNPEEFVPHFLGEGCLIRKSNPDPAMFSPIPGCTS